MLILLCGNIRRAVSQSDAMASRNLARVQLALESTTRDFLRGADEQVRADLAGQLDSKTRLMVQDYGELQTQVGAGL